MFKIASATIVAMTGVMADISADLAQSTTTIQAMNNQSGANDAMVNRLNDKSKVFRQRDAKMKVQIESDKEALKALTVKFYAAKSDHDNLEKVLKREATRLAKGKALLTAERATQKRLRDVLRKINDEIVKKVKFVKKTKKALAKKAVKNDRAVRVARREARQ